MLFLNKVEKVVKMCKYTVKIVCKALHTACDLRDYRLVFNEGMPTY